MTLRYIIGVGAQLKLMAWVFLLEKGRLFFVAIWWPFTTGRCGATVPDISVLVKAKL
jgi:hypothetical protein